MGQPPPHSHHLRRSTSPTTHTYSASSPGRMLRIARVVHRLAFSQPRGWADSRSIITPSPAHRSLLPPVGLHQRLYGGGMSTEEQPRAGPSRSTEPIPLPRKRTPSPSSVAAKRARVEMSGAEKSSQGGEPLCPVPQVGTTTDGEPLQDAEGDRRSSSGPSSHPSGSSAPTSPEADTPLPHPLVAASADPLPTSTSPLDYRHGLFLAPMVRIGTLPTRLCALQYGASLVWGPEIVDRAIVGSTRVQNASTGLIEYLKSDSLMHDRQVFSCHPVEKPLLVFQLGSASPQLAFEAVRKVADDVAAVDLNCGCPKNFSTAGGMGANLLSTPDLLCDILVAMRRAAPAHVAVTCKIRLLPTQEDTVKLVRRIVRTGAVDAITVHCRTKEMRPREPALLGRMREVVQAIREESQGRVAVVENGDCWRAGEMEEMMDITGVTSVMIARGAEANPSCFREEGPLDVARVVAPQYLRYAVGFRNPFGNTKYCVQAMHLRSQGGLQLTKDENRAGGVDRRRRPQVANLRVGEQAATSTTPTAAAAALSLPPLPLSKKEAHPIKQDISRAKTVQELVRAFGMTWDESTFDGVRNAEEAATLLRDVEQAVRRRVEEREERRRRAEADR